MRTHVDLFSGVGGFSLACQWAGVETIAFAETDSYASRVLQRHWPGVRNYGDVREVPAFESVWLVTGGVPCQPASSAGKRQARLMTVGSGRRLLPLLKGSGPRGFCLRTLLASCLLTASWSSNISALRWNCKATKFSRLLFRLRPLTQNTEGTGFGLLPTPNVAGGGNSCELKPHQGHFLRPSGKKAHLGLDQVAKMLPTPRSVEWKNSDYQQKGDYRWNTLTGEAKLMATPQARDFRTGQAERWDNPSRSRTLNDQAGGKLSVIFVEWLMGYPQGWTDLDVSETPSCHRSRTNLSSE